MEEFKIVHYKTKGIDIDISISILNATAWFTITDLEVIFKKSRTILEKVIKNIYKDGIANMAATRALFAQVRSEGTRKVHRQITYFNLDIVSIISYKMNSNIGQKLIKFVNDYLNQKSQILIPDSKNIIYDNGKLKIPVYVSEKEETVYIGQNEMATLFETTQQNVSLHIKNIIEEGELGANSVHKYFLYTASDGKEYEVLKYNLDMILAVGYRVKTKAAIEFRRWASEIIKKYMIKGYAINDERLLQHNSILLDLQNRVLKVEKNINKQITYFPGDQLRGFIEIKRFLETAENEILIIDNYFGHEFDEVLDRIKVKKTVITNPNNSKIDTNENYKVIKTDLFHDRYIFVDEVCYFSGGSFKDLGTHESVMMRLQDLSIKDIFEKLKKYKGGENIHK